MRSKRKAARGQLLVEFALVVVVLMVVMFAAIEFDRMVLVYNALAHAARVGARYAIVHGASRSGSAGSSPSAPSSSSNYSQVTTVVTNAARAGALDVSKLSGFPGGIPQQPATQPDFPPHVEPQVPVHFEPSQFQTSESVCGASKTGKPCCW